MGKTKDKREGARHRGEIDRGETLGAVMQRETAQAQAGGEESVGDPHRVEDFEGARENAECLRGLRALGRLVDNAAAHAVARQFAGHR